MQGRLGNKSGILETDQVVADFLFEGLRVVGLLQLPARQDPVLAPFKVSGVGMLSLLRNYTSCTTAAGSTSCCSGSARTGVDGRWPGSASTGGFRTRHNKWPLLHGVEVALFGVLDLAVFFVSLGQRVKDFLKRLWGKRVLLYSRRELGPVIEDGIGAEKQAADLLESFVIVPAQLIEAKILDDPSRRKLTARGVEVCDLTTAASRCRTDP